MFDLNFIAEPGIQTDNSDDCWSFLHKRKIIEEQSSQNGNSSWDRKIKVHGSYIALVLYALLIITGFTYYFINSNQTISPDMVLNQVVDLIIESGYMQDLQLGKQVVSGEIVWNPNLQGQLVRSIHRRLVDLRTTIPDELATDLIDTPSPINLPSIMRIIEEHDISEELLHRTLPNTRFTFRNTRKMLKEIGFNFPRVTIKNIPIDPGPFQNVLHQTDDFIINHLGINMIIGFKYRQSFSVSYFF